MRFLNSLAVFFVQRDYYNTFLFLLIISFFARPLFIKCSGMSSQFKGPSLAPQARVGPRGHLPIDRLVLVMERARQRRTISLKPAFSTEGDSELFNEQSMTALI